MKDLSRKDRQIDRGVPLDAPSAQSAPGDGEFSVEDVHNPEETFDRLVREYSTALLRLSFMYLRNRESAEDAVQETFLRVYRNLDTACRLPAASEKAWVTTITVNICRDVLRSAWARRVNVVEELHDIPCEDPDGTDDSLLREVMALKTKYREVILLFYYQDMKISDISRLLNAPESTVSVRLKRAREQLKTRLEGWADE